MRLSLALWRQIYRLLYSMTVKVAWPKNSFLFSSQYHKLNPKFYASLLQGILDFRFNFCWSNKKMVLIDLQQHFTLYIQSNLVLRNFLVTPNYLFLIANCSLLVLVPYIGYKFILEFCSKRFSFNAWITNFMVSF